VFGDLGAPALLLMAAIALVLWGAARFPGAAHLLTDPKAELPESLAGRAYLDRLFGPAPASKTSQRRPR
jgi:hypothetical protein